MRIILSRKGFDTTSGGVPSPILPDGRLRSLPIPEQGAIQYAQIYSNDAYPTGTIVEVLTKGKVRADSTAHLDPDVDYYSVPNRHSDWRGVFGQSDGSQTHLANQKVGEGDLFLFYGLYQATEGDAKNLEYVKESPDIHTFWGWLQVDKVVPVTENTARDFPQYKDHPHLTLPEHNKGDNVIYIGKQDLEIGGVTKSLRGYGTFPAFDPRLQLTAEGKNTSMWCLPQWFEEKGLTYHSDKFRGCCEKDQSKVLLESTSPGQEFVIDLGGDTAVALEWLQGIFDCAQES